MDQTDKISIIVPVYNVEKYLGECIESLLNQTYSPFEIILIDDGSTDKSGYICDCFAQKNKLVRVFHQNNLGVSMARNRALLMATGKYIVFVDADDLVSSLYLETLINYMYSSEADLPICGYTREKNKLVSYDGDLNSQIMMLSADYIYNHLLNHEKFEGYLWNKLFCKSIIMKNHIEFQPGINIWEDMCFYASYLKYIDKIAIGSDNLYFYRDNDSSVTNTISMKNYESLVSASKFLVSLESNKNCLYYQKSRKLLVEQLISYMHSSEKTMLIEKDELSSNMKLLLKTKQECNLSFLEKLKLLWIWMRMIIYKQKQVKEY